MSLVVVKAGGSLAAAGSMPDVLRHLARHAGGVVIVPGGGEFADAVRQSQMRRGFADDVAHHLALLAMRMNALVMVAQGSPFRIADTVGEAVAAAAEGAVPVCVPVREILAEPELAASWNVTSDSIAAWVAEKAEARALLVVKSCAIAAGDAACADSLAAAGVVDAAFPRAVGRYGGEWEAVAGEAGLSGALARLFPPFAARVMRSCT